MDRHLNTIRQRSNIDLNNETQIIELESLFEFSKLLSNSIKLTDILNNIMFTIMGRMMISKSTSFIVKNSKYYPILSKGVKIDQQMLSFKNLPLKPFLIDDQQDEEIKKLKELKLVIGIPFIQDDNIIGLICFGKKMTNEEYIDSELNFLFALCRIATPSIKNSMMVDEILGTQKQLDNRVQQLLTLMEIGQRLNATLDFDEIVKSISRSLMGQLLISKHAIIYEFESGCKISLQRGLKLEYDSIDYIRKHQKELINDTYLVDKGIMLVTPLYIQNKVNGYLLCGTKMDNSDYREDEIDFINSIANIAASALENAILFQDTIIKQKLEEELRLAKSIQRQLLPNENPKLMCGEIIGTNDSSKQVGGDYYDFIPVEDNVIGIAIGDVSGKGAAASLLMSNLQATMHALTLDRSNSIISYMDHANSIIYKNTSSEKYITFFYGELDQLNRTLSYVNAGHNYPLLFRGDELIELKKGGIILGMMEGLPYEQEQVSLLKDDVLVLYTDGITEAMDTQENEFGEERLIQVVKSAMDKSANEIHQLIIQNVFEFCPNANEFDDITLIVMKMS